MSKAKKLRQWGLLAAKIAVGSSGAIFLAQLLELDHYTSAGIITLLTLMTTKWETLQLSVFRLITFIITMIVGGIAFHFIDTAWISYGVFIFFLIFLSYALGWHATISVNAVLGTHLLLDGSFGVAEVQNEFLLVIIGVVIAIILNLFRDYKHQRKTIIANMRYVERQMQKMMRELAAYFSDEEVKLETWGGI